MKIATGTRGHNVEYYNDSAVAKVALTIDDAPSKSCSHFRKLLDMLQRLQVKVSFQVISSYAQMSEEHMLLMRRVVRDGHQLVNHSTHDERCTSLAESQFRDRLHTCQALIDTLAPHRARWFRPPSGVMNATMRRVCAQEGYRVALGDCYSDDPHISDPDFHVSTLLHSASAGSVLIVHCPEPGRREQTLLVLPRLVEGLRQKNLTLTTLDDLFATSTPPPPPVTTPKAPPVSSPPPDTLAPPVSVSAATASTREIDSADHRL